MPSVVSLCHHHAMVLAPAIVSPSSPCRGLETCNLITPMSVCNTPCCACRQGAWASVVLAGQPVSLRLPACLTAASMVTLQLTALSNQPAAVQLLVNATLGIRWLQQSCVGAGSCSASYDGSAQQTGISVSLENSGSMVSPALPGLHAEHAPPCGCKQMHVVAG